MLKICMISQTSWPAIGGMETHLVTNARLLSELGFEVSIVTGSNYPVSVISDLHNYARTYHCPGLGNVSKASGAFFETVVCLRRIFDKIQPDVLHAHDPILAWISDLILVNRSIPLVLTLHWMLDGPGAGKLHRGWGTVADREKLPRIEWDFFCSILQKCKPDAAIAVGEAFVSVLRRLGIGDEKIVRISNGVMLETETGDQIPQVFERLSSSLEGNLVAIAPKRLIPVKNIELLLEAFEFLVDAPVKLILTGPEVPYMKDYADRIRSRIRSARLTGNVILLDEPVRYEQMPAIYEMGSVVMMMSKKEGLSIGLLEGMAAGLVPVVSDIPGNRQVVTDRVNGIVVSDSSAESLAKELRLLAENPGLVKNLSGEAKKLVAEKYNARDRARELGELYTRLVLSRQKANQ